MQRRLDAPAVCSNCNQRRDLLTERSGRRSLPPAPIRRRRRDGQSQYRGVSDHEIWTAFAITPAATEEVAHATLSLSQPEQVDLGRVRPAACEGVRICVVHHRPSRSIVRLAARALKALRASSFRSARAARG